MVGPRPKTFGIPFHEFHAHYSAFLISHFQAKILTRPLHASLTKSKELPTLPSNDSLQQSGGNTQFSYSPKNIILTNDTGNHYSGVSFR